jgi:hypothetical protein
MYVPQDTFAVGGSIGWYGVPDLYPTYAISLPSDWTRWGSIGPAHPDFFPTGAPIQFGFWSGFDFYSGLGSLADGIDNWSVTISSTVSPEPGCAMMWTGFLAIRLCRRWGRNREWTAQGTCAGHTSAAQRNP